jgi:hypothetical protein
VLGTLFFTADIDWKAAPPPAAVRPAALEVVHAMITAQAELQRDAPAALDDVLEELVVGMLEGAGQVGWERGRVPVRMRGRV